MRSFALVFSPLMVAVIVVGYFYYESRNDSPRQVSVDAQAAAQTAPTPFIYGNGDPNDYSQGDQTFGGQNSLGIWKSIADAYPNEMGNFEFIRNKIADREQYIAQEDTALTDPNRVWQTIIGGVGTVNGETRLRVVNLVGKDYLAENSYRMDATHTISEIWKLVQGSQPVLLDRTLGTLDGLLTQTESPQDNPESTIDESNPNLPGDGVDELFP